MTPQRPLPATEWPSPASHVRLSPISSRRCSFSLERRLAVFIAVASRREPISALVRTASSRCASTSFRCSRSNLYYWSREIPRSRSSRMRSITASVAYRPRLRMEGTTSWMIHRLNALASGLRERRMSYYRPGSETMSMSCFPPGVRILFVPFSSSSKREMVLLTSVSSRHSHTSLFRFFKNFQHVHMNPSG